jgi:hypothetical protein
MEKTKRPTQAETNAVMRDCLQRFQEEWKATPAHLREEYLAAMTTIGISIMHGTLGKEFTKGFLYSAQQSLNDQATVTFREPKNH